MVIQVIPDTPNNDKMEITLEQNSNSIEQEMLDLPQTQTVEDNQLQKQLAQENQFIVLKRRKQSSSEIYDSPQQNQQLQLPKNKAVSFIDKNPLFLEPIEESPNSRPLSKAKDM